MLVGVIVIICKDLKIRALILMFRLVLFIISQQIILIKLRRILIFTKERILNFYIRPFCSSIHLPNLNQRMRLFLIFVLTNILTLSSLLKAQENCLNDPSCQHTKAMLWEASRQWNHGYKGINHNARSDSLDVLHYTVALDMTQHEEAWVTGHCVVQFRAKKEGVQALPLDLLQMQVDSVLLGQQPLEYDYNDTLLTVYLADPLKKDALQQVTIYYKGHPLEDKTWGGFYYKDDYAYNLGVGFAADPHNYGRVWHPCFDNFKERATYTFHIKTKGNQRAHCNGSLLSERTIDGITTRTWQLKDPIPTYLACIAVGNYTTVHQQYQGVQETIPIELVAEAQDTSKLKESFQHLDKAIAAYEYWYGPHRWSKVGYSLVPFRSGAMEHVTNIAYPISAANGSLKREHLMAHELGHSWWGNLVTCATAQDMWINEGMASYSEDLFWEYTYGWEHYIEDVKKNHYRVLKMAHRQEKGYRPISGVPHEYTYGMHVYNKGASVAHNMRWYMGDTAFRKGLHYITSKYAFKNLNSAAFRDGLTQATGVDMAAFFDDWVFRGGYPHFEIEQFKTTLEKERYKVDLVVAQKLVGRTVYCQKVPLQLTFLDDNWNKFQTVIEVSGALDSASIHLPFLPSSILVNEEHRLNQARYDEQLYLERVDMPKAKVKCRELGMDYLLVKQACDSAWLHLQHHDVPPSHQTVPKGYRISKQHYWTIEGVVPPDFEAELTIEAHRKLDADLLGKAGTDSLLLLYRPTVNDPWQVHPNFVKSAFLGRTVFAFTTLKGDYALANGPQAEVYREAPKKIKFVELKCTPTKNSIQVQIATAGMQKVLIECSDLKGNSICQKTALISKKKKTIVLPLNRSQEDIYFIKVRNNKGQIIQTQKVYLKR